MRRIVLTVAAVAALAAPLHARDVAVRSVIYQELRTQAERTITATSELRRGDRVVTLLDWSSAENVPVTMTTAVPRDLSFLDASADALEVSTDGGRSWYPADANRPGRVTHFRWQATPGRGRMTYSAVVR